MSVHIQIERFEGPLALLLHLIRKEEMDIFDINIQQITRQYLDYIKAMKQLDLEVAGEFVAMAATLIHIKSRLLLPQYNDEGEVMETEDPRKELVQRLLEYQKYKEASEALYSRPLVGRDLWLRGERLDLAAAGVDGEIIMDEDNALFALISAYRSAVKNMRKSIHRVGGAMQSISERILELRGRLIVGSRLRLRDLITPKEQPEQVVNQVLITFLSLLELAKMGFVSLFQTDPSSDIYVETHKVIDREVVVRAESYENKNPEAAGELMIQEAQAENAEIFTEAQILEEAVNQGERFEEASHPVTTFPVESWGEAQEVPASEWGVQAATDEEIQREEERLAMNEGKGEAP